MVITASSAREKLFPLIEQVNTDSTAIHITSKNGNAVLISESEYESIMETLFILSNPDLVKKIQNAVVQLDAGKGIEMEFVNGKVQARTLKEK
jgi:antitoxin YefM